VKRTATFIFEHDHVLWHRVGIILRQAGFESAGGLILGTSDIPYRSVITLDSDESALARSLRPGVFVYQIDWLLMYQEALDTARRAR